MSSGRVAGGGGGEGHKPRGPRPPPPSARRFLAAFAGVALSFLGSTAYSQYVQAAIDRDATEITDNAAPSIEHLGKARTELRQIQILIQAYSASGRTDRERQGAIARARAALGEEVRAYVALPTFPGEPELWRDVSRDLDAADEVIDRTVRGFERAEPEDATEISGDDLAAAVDRATQAIGRSVDLDAREARRLAESIQVTRSRAKVIERTLDAVSAVLALVAGFLLYRTVRDHADLLRDHDCLMERRADELEQFSGRVAHDILSPLGAVSMALAITEKSLDSDPRAKAAITRGQRNLRRVQQIVSGLLEFARAGARPTAGASTEVGPVLADVLSDVKLCAEEVGIEVTNLPFEPCSVACSEGILASLLSNLLRNAIKYMGDGSERRVNVRVIDLEEAVRVEVADTGPGIPADLREMIFQPYFRAAVTGQPGIGLGLATVKRVTETHSGRVGVHSAVGRGSVFWFELPKPGATAGEEPARGASAG